MIILVEHYHASKAVAKFIFIEEDIERFEWNWLVQQVIMALYFAFKVPKKREELEGLICRSQLGALASAWVLWNLFDNEREDLLFVSEQSSLPKSDEQTGRFLLDEICMQETSAIMTIVRNGRGAATQ